MIARSLLKDTNEASCVSAGSGCGLAGGSDVSLLNTAILTCSVIYTLTDDPSGYDALMIEYAFDNSGSAHLSLLMLSASDIAAGLIRKFYPQYLLAP